MGTSATFFLFKSTLLRFNLQKIKYTHSKWPVQCVLINIYTHIHSQPQWRYGILAQKVPSFCFRLQFPTQAPGNYWAAFCPRRLVSPVFKFHLNFIYTLSCLASFTKYNSFEIHLCCCTYQYFIPFSSIVWTYHNFFMHSSVDGCFWSFRVWAITIKLL